MAAPIKLNLKVYQGSTFSQVLRWESSTRVYVPISNISRSAPMQITAPAHGVPVGWRVRVTNAGGIKEVNALDYITVTSTTENTLTFNSINSSAYTAYTSGGILEYNSPIDLTNITARMQLREKVTSSDVILELTTENNRIVINNALKTISLNIPADITQTLNFKSVVYSLELINDNVVVPFAYGNVSLVTEVTR